MKKVLLLLCLLVAGILPSFAQCNPVFFDGFESGTYTPTWTLGANLTPSVVTTAPAVGTYCLSGTGGASTHLTGLSASFTAATPGSIGWYIKPSSATAACNYLVAGNSAVNATNCIVFAYWQGSTNTIRFVSSITYAHPAVLNQWYHIELRNINWISHVFDIYIDNALVASSFPFRNNTQNDVSRIHLYNFNAGQSYWDHITLGNLPPVVNATSTPSSPVCAGTSITLQGSGALNYTWNGIPTLSSDTTFAASSTGTYTVVGTDANNCTASSTISIAVNPAPAVSASVNPGTICVGASAVLTGGGANTYVWNPGALPGSPSVSPGVTTTYTLTGTDATGCSATSTVQLTVGSAPAPSVVEDTLCSPGGTASLAASGSLVRWYDAPVGGTLLHTGNTYNPTVGSTTTYYVDNTALTQTSPVAIPLPPQTGTFSSNIRGYYFTAPTNFTITSLEVPTTANAGPQSIAVVKFTGNVAPPLYSTTTNAFTTVFLTQSNPAAGSIAANIPVQAGEVIGILGCRTTTTSYATGPGATTIAGFPVTLARLGMQFPLTTTAPQDLWTENGGSIGRVSFEYTLSDTGCTSSPRIPVNATVVPAPVVTASPAAQSICQNNSATLNGGGALSYSWTGGISNNTPFTVTSSGVYTVTGTDVNGCTATATASVTMNNLPSVTASANPPALCLGSSVIFSGGGAASYLWTDGVTSPVDGISFTPLSTGTSTYTVTGTDANGCTGTSTLNFTINGAALITAGVLPNDTVCANEPVTLAGNGGVSYTWSGGVTDNVPFPLVAPGTYTVTGTDGNGCTGTSSIDLFTWPAPSPLSISSDPVVPEVCGINPVILTASGANAYSWNGGVQNGISFYPPSSGVYTVTGSDGNGCSVTATISVTVNTASGNLALVSGANVLSISGSSTTNYNQAPGTHVKYYNAACNLVCEVETDALTDLDNVVAQVVVSSAVQTYNGQPYARRRYLITPATNGPALNVILPILQADFNSYNLASPLWPQLPTGPADLSGIANIRITKITGGTLGVGTPTVITPMVNWNGSYWELSFPVTGFSEFYVHGVNPGNVPLPVTVSRFEGRKQAGSNLLEWSTGSEQNSAYFNLQHSTNGTDFSTIAKLESKAANGHSSSTLNYQFEHKQPQIGHNYYRLQQVDLDQQESLHAKVIDLMWGADGNSISIYPNPTRDVLNIDLYSARVENTVVKVLDMSGRVVKQMQARTEAGLNKLSVSLGELAGGLYTVQVFESGRLGYTGKVQLSK